MDLGPYDATLAASARLRILVEELRSRGPTRESTPARHLTRGRSSKIRGSDDERSSHAEGYCVEGTDAPLGTGKNLLNMLPALTVV